jgi:sulfonate transport system substrate-binding protein
MKLARKAIVLLAVLVVGYLAWLTLRVGEKPKADDLQIGIGTFSQAIDYGPVYVARHFRWFEEALQSAGVATEPQYREYGGFDEIQTAFAQGKLHAFFSAEAPAIKLRSEKQNIRVVEVGCTLQQEVLVRTQLNITSVAQLKGRSIAVAEGTSSHYGLLRILSSAGLSPSDIRLRPGFPGDAKPLFESGAVDAWAVWPPFVEEEVIAKRGHTLPGGDAKIQSVMSIQSDLMEQHPAVAHALVSAIQRAKKWMAANPDEAQSIVAKQLKLDSEVIHLAWPKHNWSATLSDDVLADMNEKSKFLTKMGVVRNGVVINIRTELVDNRYAK